jgi:ribosomal protein S27AE
MSQKVRCTNMNHGRSQSAVKFCPTCGEVVNAKVQDRCDETFHAAQRKNRNNFCYRCGKKL